LAEASRLIEDLPKMAKNKIFPLEQKNSLRAIEELRQQLFRMLPPDPLAELREKLGEAIANEDYEEAARLRDSLQKREDRSEPS
ncbi:MAG: UvrB/UvrC motif-containing protein, partial [Planctomycetes bacterium]|nr:UvrB/UvrC motif-containing protein [Planctomycetota bacterium]